MKKFDLQHAQIHVTTANKYKYGNMQGCWVKLKEFDNSEEFYKYCRELFDEDDSELQFLEWEDIPEEFIDQFELDDRFFELRDARISDYEAFFVWRDHENVSLTDKPVDKIIANFEEEYCGKYVSDEDFAWSIVDKIDDVSGFIKQYMDFSQLAEDLLAYDYWTVDGYYFRN